jgi:hypothetical protein
MTHLTYACCNRNQKALWVQGSGQQGPGRRIVAPTDGTHTAPEALDDLADLHRVTALGVADEGMRILLAQHEPSDGRQDEGMPHEWEGACSERRSRAGRPCRRRQRPLAGRVHGRARPAATAHRMLKARRTTRAPFAQPGRKLSVRRSLIEGMAGRTGEGGRPEGSVVGPFAVGAARRRRRRAKTARRCRHSSASSSDRVGVRPVAGGRRRRCHLFRVPSTRDDRLASTARRGIATTSTRQRQSERVIK